LPDAGLQAWRPGTGSGAHPAGGDSRCTELYLSGRGARDGLQGEFLTPDKLFLGHFRVAVNAWRQNQAKNGKIRVCRGPFTVSFDVGKAKPLETWLTPGVRRTMERIEFASEHFASVLPGAMRLWCKTPAQ
jgi:hypothetical protein